MAVPEKGGVPIGYAHPRDHAINARTDLFGAFPARAAVAENHPPG